MQQEMHPGSSCSSQARKRNVEPEFKRSISKVFLKSLDPCITILLSKSRIEHENDQEHFEDVISFYEALYAFTEMKNTMQMVASAAELEIWFDFNRETVKRLDPKNPGSAEGRTYGTGRILIAAKRNRELVLGTLAHELTHFVLIQVYKNGCLPYSSDDNTRQEEFTKIVAECYERRKASEIIRNVYDDRVYSGNEVPIELIVRVPQLKVLNRNNSGELLRLRRIF